MVKGNLIRLERLSRTEPNGAGNSEKTPLEFRSPLLMKMPRVETADRIKRITRRMGVTALVAVAILGLIYLVVAQPLAKDGAGYWLYWFHDHVFLLAKGYTYTLYFPISLIWWGVTVTMLAIWLVPFLIDRSLIRFLHLVLVRLAVHQVRLHPILVRTTRWLKYLGLEPQLLKAVVERERTLALNRLVASPPAQAGHAECATVAHLTHLLIQLLTLPRSSLVARLDALVCWHQALLQIRYYGDRQADWLFSLTADLVKDLGDLIRPILNYQDHNQLKDALMQPVSFAPVSIAVDLLYLACLSDEKVAERMFSGEAARPARKQERLICSWLAAAVAARRVILDQARSRFEWLALPNHTVPAEADLTDITQKIPTADTNLSALGQLSLTIALDLAALTNAPELALGYLDTIEALSLALGFIGPQANSRVHALAQRLSRLTKDLPRPEDYKLCARLAELRLEEQKREWPPIATSLKADDFVLAETRPASLYHAAGPDPA